MPSPPASRLRKSSFPPVVDAETRVLVLGSLPGEESLARRQYYANPRNQFWRLVGAVVETDLAALPYERRLRALLATGLGLWDVVASATREGSLDGAIRAHRPNPLAELAGSLPELRAIAFNGQTSARLGARALGGRGGWTLLALPSSSPAFTLGFERKLDRWMALRPFLDSAAGAA